MFGKRILGFLGLGFRVLGFGDWGLGSCQSIVEGFFTARFSGRRITLGVGLNYCSQMTEASRVTRVPFHKRNPTIIGTRIIFNGGKQPHGKIHKFVPEAFGG